MSEAKRQRLSELTAKPELTEEEDRELVYLTGFMDAIWERALEEADALKVGAEYRIVKIPITLVYEVRVKFDPALDPLSTYTYELVEDLFDLEEEAVERAFKIFLAVEK